MRYVFQSVAVVAFFATVRFGANSPFLNTFLMCREMGDLSAGAIELSGWRRMGGI